MFFSIVIPIYNAEKTLDRCLQSIVDQEFTDYEVIMVNDGSVDKSSEICKKYLERDERFTYIEQQNSGVSEARNTGIKKAQGEFLAFIDSDDIYYKKYLDSFYKLIYECPEIDNYWCKYESMIDNDEIKQKESSFSRDKLSFWSRQTIMNLHEIAMDGAPWNKVYRRDIIIENNIFFNKEISLGEDMMFNYDYLDKTSDKIAVIETPLYGYFCSSIESLNSKYRNDLKEIYEKLDNYIRNYLIKWKVFEIQKNIYYNSVFYRQENVLRNTYRTENHSLEKEKYNFNASIIQSQKFKDALKNSNCFIHPIYRMAYLSGKYWMVMLVDKLVNIAKRK